MRCRARPASSSWLTLLNPSCSSSVGRSSSSMAVAVSVSNRAQNSCWGSFSQGPAGCRSTSTNQPPGSSSRRALRSTRSRSLRGNSCRATLSWMALKLASARGGSSASPSTRFRLGWRWAAKSRARGETSSPVTAYPAASQGAAASPLPQQRSSTAAPGLRWGCTASSPRPRRRSTPPTLSDDTAVTVS